MNQLKTNFLFLAMLVLSASTFLTSCNKDDEDEDTSYDVPSTYVFTDAEGRNTVSYTGQTERLDMVAEITSYLKTGNNGAQLDADKIKEMYRNIGDHYSASNLNGSTKQIFDKIAPSVQSKFDEYADAIEQASLSSDAAADGTAGVADNGEKQYLLDENGYEFTQLIEKGLMGALMYYQGTSVYLGDGKMDVDNSGPADEAAGKYYTTMEHHWDEAFGYFGVPTDFPQSKSDRFWGKYCDGRDELLGSNQKIMDAFLKGRAAISNDDLTTRDNMITDIRNEWELVVAGTAIHYLNDARGNTDPVTRNHQLSEAYAFIFSLKFNEGGKVTNAQVDGWLDDLGDNLYATTDNDLTTIRDEISSVYSLDDVKANL